MSEREKTCLSAIATLVLLVSAMGGYTLGYDEGKDRAVRDNAAACADDLRCAAAP